MTELELALINFMDDLKTRDGRWTMTDIARLIRIFEEK